MAPGCAHVRDLWQRYGRQGEPVFSARIALSIDGVSDHVLSYPQRPGRGTRQALSGSASAIVEQLVAYQELGLAHVVFETSTQSHDSSLATMEAFMAQIKPQLG
jgi:hypothetical protein